jgi:hypothetical protein
MLVVNFGMVINQLSCYSEYLGAAVKTSSLNPREMSLERQLNEEAV